jgi:hypothetical protein
MFVVLTVRLKIGQEELDGLTMMVGRVGAGAVAAYGACVGFEVVTRSFEILLWPARGWDIRLPWLGMDC